ncbi:MAG: hypothetical protein Q9216_006632, partial [Gyalolechia sp. 2 TL-2023]
MAKSLRTPRGKRGQRPKSPTATEPKLRRVSKPEKKRFANELPRKIKKNGMKTKANPQQLSQSFDDLQNSQPVEDLQIPSTPKTPQTSDRSKQKISLWQLLSADQSFWDVIKDSYNDRNGSKTSNFGDDDIEAIMNRLNQQVSHQFDSYKYEDAGFLSSSPSGNDPRETKPVNEEEVEDLRIAMWPTLQHLTELTKCRPLPPHSNDCYLTQVRYVREQLRDTWQNKGLLGNPPSPFQLEAWTGGITNVRRFPKHPSPQTDLRPGLYSLSLLDE